MRGRLRRFGILLSLLCVLFTIVSVWVLFWNISNEYHHNWMPAQDMSRYKEHLRYSKNSNSQNRISSNQNWRQVEVWGKASIGMYFWIHIMNGNLEASSDTLIMTGNITSQTSVYNFRTGPGIIQSTVPSDVQYLILILNGHSPEKVRTAAQWLTYVPLYKRLKKLALILLGSELCNNDWILPYMKSQGGMIDVVFLVYDSPVIDNKEFYQWPLGVSVYRGFPNIFPGQLDITVERPYICNFLGTVYENSSRVTLKSVIQSLKLEEKCIFKGRESWLPNETRRSIQTYMYTLLSSDLTLNPVGKNTECYRIYEAMSLGSVPVIEDVITPGMCDISPTSPLRLLKENNAPVIYVKSWTSLAEVLFKESQLTLTEKVKRREKVLKWYKHFKEAIHQRFLNVVESKFFGD